MFEYLKHTKVLVMGYPRAGTHICAAMLAYDTGLCYVHEDQWGKRDPDGLWNYLESYDGFVTPCPGIEDFKRFGQRDDTYVILMRREPCKIRASSVRVKGGLAKLSPRESIRRINERYAKWQREKIFVKNFTELKHEDLKDHPLWIDAPDRAKFTQVQIHPTLDYEDLIDCARRK